MDALFLRLRREHGWMSKQQIEELVTVNILDQLIPEAGAFYIVGRAYVDFERLA